VRSEFTDEEWGLVTELADYPYRLVVTATPDHEGTFAEVAHEAIFRRWNRLRDWITSEREFLIWLARINRDAQRYSKLPLSVAGGALLNDFSLQEAAKWTALHESELPKVTRDFIQISQIASNTEKRGERVSRLIRRSAIYGVGVSVAVISVSFFLVMISTWIVGLINLNDRTNICLQNEADGLRTIIREISNGKISAGDERLSSIANDRFQYGTRHPCYRIQNN
jgi:hypothetical protein